MSFAISTWASRRRAHLYGLLLSGLLLLVLPVSGSAQKEAPASDHPPWPKIGHVEILVLDKGTDEELTPIRARDTLRLGLGQTLRLRVTAVPEARGRQAKYPSAKFTVLSGPRRVRLTGVDEKVGRALITGNRIDDPRGRETWIRYEILRPMVPEKLRQGSFRVEVFDMEESTEDTASAVVSDSRGVTLYANVNFGGVSQMFVGDAPDLRRTVVGNNNASSLRVSDGCRVILYEDLNYEGRSVVLTGDVYRLRGLEVGNDRASSLRVLCD